MLRLGLGHCISHGSRQARQSPKGQNSEVTYDRCLRLTIPLRGVDGLVAMLFAVTTTGMSEGSPAMPMSKPAELVILISECQQLVHFFPEE